MAANLIPFRPAGIGACAASAQRRSDSNQRKTGGSGSSANWWTPLFGWSSEPDYIDSGNSNKLQIQNNGSEKVDQDLSRTRTRFTPGSFTDEKARRLRMMTKETESFHDAMYHSAIASRLASDFKDSSDL